MQPSWEKQWNKIKVSSLTHTNFLQFSAAGICSSAIRNLSGKPFYSNLKHRATSIIQTVLLEIYTHADKKGMGAIE